MKIHLSDPNTAFIGIIKNPKQTITLDANFLIPPDRTPITKSPIKFDQFKEIWLEPIFQAFPNLAIHEAVYAELVGHSPQNYIDQKMDPEAARLTLLKDTDLTEIELMLRDAIESRIVPRTKYEPLLDNKDDRGEVKSLAYIAVKELLYFAAHDHNALQLIEKAEEWSTGLDNVHAIRMFELIYYLYRKKMSDQTALKMLYKYQYYLTDREKNENPSWGNFHSEMDSIYKQYFC